MAKSFPNTGATVIDSAADLPAASAALEGILMFQKDTNELKICDGASWVSVVDTDTPPAMQLILPTSVVNGTNNAGNITFSGVSSVSVNGVFSSSFDCYKIVGTFGVSATNPMMNIRWRAAGTDNSAASYETAVFRYTAANASAGEAAGSGETSQRLFTADNGSYSAIDMTVYWPANAGYYTKDTLIAKTRLSGAANTVSMWGSGEHLVSAAYDGFTFYPSTGTTSGNLRIYGYRNSL